MGCCNFKHEDGNFMFTPESDEHGGFRFSGNNTQNLTGRDERIEKMSKI